MIFQHFFSHKLSLFAVKIGWAVSTPTELENQMASGELLGGSSQDL